jgi:hypothetical protein
VGNDYNPYAPPRAALDAPPAGVISDGVNVWRQDDRVVLHKVGGVLPDRCVMCNAPAQGYRLRKTFYWHPPEYYLAIFLGVGVYVILALVTRKSARIELGLCPPHRARRRNGLILAWGGFLGAFVLMFVGASDDVLGLMIAGFIGLLVLPIVGAVMARTLRPAKIDEHYAWLRAGKPFVDSLPSA